LIFTTRTILGEYRSLSSSLCNFLHSPTTLLYCFTIQNYCNLHKECINVFHIRVTLRIRYFIKQHSFAILAMKPQHNILEVLTAVMKIEICSEVWLCGPVNSYRHVKGSQCLHLQVTKKYKMRETQHLIQWDWKWRFIWYLHEFHTSEDVTLRKLLPVSPSGWAPEPVCTLRRGKFLSPGGNGNFHLRSSRLQLLLCRAGDKVIFRTGMARITTDTILRC
jgi:hypothetical protein